MRWVRGVAWGLLALAGAMAYATLCALAMAGRPV